VSGLVVDVNMVYWDWNMAPIGVKEVSSTARTPACRVVAAAQVEEVSAGRLLTAPTPKEAHPQPHALTTSNQLDISTPRLTVWSGEGA
jgi:hypothetical protein